jgi:penicillin-binding protein 1A
VIAAEGARWTRKPADKAVAPGDVVYVEPLEGKAGQFRLRQVPEISGAMVAMDPYTGRVHAMVGGFSFDQSEFNRATQAVRQPGSSFKPFVYATALDNGYTPSSVVLDAPISIDLGGGMGVWEPSNYDGKAAGPRTLRYGIEHSKNLMTVRLAKDVGMPLIAEYARRFGVYDDMLPVLSMSLGAGETTVMRMTAAYSIFANGGRRIKPTLIDRIQDRSGRTIYRHDDRQCETCTAEGWKAQNEPKLVDNREQVLDPLTAYQVTSMLEGVVQRGTAQVIKSVGKPLAGKTGTTNDAKDVWFVGFSPDLAVGVYLGYDQPKSLGNSATAGQYAAPVFRDFMQLALKDKPATPFRVPPGIKLIRISASTGMRAGSGEGGGVILEAFKPGTAPPDSYSVIGEAQQAGVPGPEAQRAVGTGTGGLY